MDPDEGAARADSSWTGPPRPNWEESVRRLTRREHALSTIMELSRSFTGSTDLYRQIDTLLFGTMGQLGTSRGALWVLSEELGTMPVLLRCHGFQRPLMLGFGSMLTPRLFETLRSSRTCLTARELEAHQDESQKLLTRKTGIAAVATVSSAHSTIGLVVIGDRLDRGDYDGGDYQVLETAVGIMGMTLINARLHGELSETNRQLRQHNESMQELDRIKAEFIANVNHELRTPLTVIQASLELLREKAGTDAESKTMMDMALGASSRLRGLVENLLIFSALRREPTPGEPVPVDVAELLREFHQNRLPGVNAHLRDLGLLCEDGLPPVLADPQALVRILDELVNNAVKFTPHGARIELRARKEGVLPDGLIQIQVRDDGPGIAAERLSTLFREFEHGGASQPARAGGIGLGLALARELARQMGGDLQVSSAPDEGACLTVCLRALDRRRGRDAQELRPAA